MMVSNRGSVLRLLMWQWRAVAFSSAGGLFAALVWQFVPALHVLWLPAAPLAVVGAALGIFVSFRTNSAYDRWWEGRKLWGRMINVSRHFATQVLNYLPASERPLQRRLVHRHAAYVHALRCLLRQQDPLEDAEFLRAVPDDPEQYRGQSNITHALLHRQSAELVALDDAGGLSEFRLQSMDRSLEEMLAVQGGCERIKKTPMPRGYGFIASRLIIAYGLMFPLGLVAEIGWLVLPINVLVVLSFALISEAGRVLEDPFTMFWNGLPMTNMSMMIERNLGDRLGDEELVEIPTIDERGILM
ncbi:MAG: bestrophin family ion channel [Nannocystaceae bacterium]